MVLEPVPVVSHQQQQLHALQRWQPEMRLTLFDWIF